MASHLALWGTLRLVFDHPSFAEGYESGREYYFSDVSEAQRAGSPLYELPTTALMQVIALPDETGHYQLDDGLNVSAFERGVEELLGILVGYLSGPLHPETSAERQKRLLEEEELLRHQMMGA